MCSVSCHCHLTMLNHTKELTCCDPKSIQVTANRAQNTMLHNEGKGESNPSCSMVVINQVPQATCAKNASAIQTWHQGTWNFAIGGKSSACRIIYIYYIILYYIILYYIILYYIILYYIILYYIIYIHNMYVVYSFLSPWYAFSLCPLPLWQKANPASNPTARTPRQLQLKVKALGISGMLTCSGLIGVIGSWSLGLEFSGFSSVLEVLDVFTLPWSWRSCALGSVRKRSEDSPVKAPAM